MQNMNEHCCDNLRVIPLIFVSVALHLVVFHTPAPRLGFERQFNEVLYRSVVRSRRTKEAAEASRDQQ